MTPTEENNSVDLNSTRSKSSKKKKHCDTTKNKKCSSSLKPSEKTLSKEQSKLLSENNDKTNSKKLDKNRAKSNKKEKTIIITTNAESSKPRKSSMITVLQHEPILHKDRTIILTKKFQTQDTSIFETAHEESSSNAIIEIERKPNTRAFFNSTTSFTKSKNKRDFSTTEESLTTVSKATTKSGAKNKIKTRIRKKKLKKISTTQSARDDFDVEVFSPIMIQSKYERQDDRNSTEGNNNSTEKENINPKVNVTQEFIKNESTSRNFSLFIEESSTNITNSINNNNTSDNSSATYKFIKNQIQSYTENTSNSSLFVTEPSKKRTRKPGKNKKGGKGTLGRTTTTEILKNFTIDPDVELLPTTKSPLKKMKHKKGNKNSTANHKTKNGSSDTINKNHTILDYNKLGRNVTDIQIGNYTAKVGSAVHQYWEKYKNNSTFANTTDLVDLVTKTGHENLENYETVTTPKIQNKEKQKKNKNKTLSTTKTSEDKLETLVLENNNRNPNEENYTKGNTTFSKKEIKTENITSKHEHEFKTHVHHCHMKCVNYWRKLYEDLLKNVSSKTNGSFQGFTPVADSIDSGLVDSSEDSLDCWKTISDSGVESSLQLPREEEKNKGEEKDREHVEKHGKKKKTKKRRKKGKKRARTTLRSREDSVTLGSVTNFDISDFVSIGKSIKPATLNDTVTIESLTSESVLKANTKEKNKNFRTTEAGDVLEPAELKNITEATTADWVWKNWWHSGTTLKDEKNVYKSLKEEIEKTTKKADFWNWWNSGTTEKEEKNVSKSLRKEIEETTREDDFWNDTLKIIGTSSEGSTLNIVSESTTFDKDSRNSKTTSKLLDMTDIQIRDVTESITNNKSICESSDCKINKSEEVEKMSWTEKYSSSTEANRKTKKNKDKCEKGSKSSRCKNKRKTTKSYDSDLETTTEKIITTRFRNSEFLSDEDFDSKETRNKNNVTKNVEVETTIPKTATTGSFWSILWGNNEDENEIKSGERTKKDDNVTSRDKKEDREDEIVENENGKKYENEEQHEKDEDDDIDIDKKDDEYYDDLEKKCRDYDHFCDGVCLAHKFICDSQQHCTDGSDEENCDKDDDNKIKIEIPTELIRIIESTTYRRPESCGEWEHYCDGKCIIGEKLCDGIRDCNDGTDEDLEECKPGRPETKVPFGPSIRPNLLYKIGFPGEK